MKFIIALSILFISATVYAQSPFKPLAKVYVAQPNRFAHATVVLPDSTLNAWRFTANLAAYGYTFNGVSQAMSGAEFGYQHEKWSYTSSKWITQWSVNAAWFPLNTAAKITSLQDLESIAVLVGVDNNLVQFGPMINPNAPKGQQIGLCISLGITLNN